MTRPRIGKPQLQFAQWLPSERATTAKETLRAAEKSRGLRGADTVSVMDPSAYSLLLVEAPDVEPAELRAALRWRVKDMIDFHIDDAVIDVFDLPGGGQRGRARMMYAVAARTAQVRSQVDIFDEVGLDLSAIDIAELALRNVTAGLPEDASGVALLHLCGGTGLIVVTHQGHLYLARSLEVDPSPGGEERALETLTLEIQRSLDYYESHFSQPPVKALVVAQAEDAGGDLAVALRQGLAVAVQPLDLGGLVDCVDPVDAGVAARCLPAIGAALRTESTTL
ncbi:MAG: hypothetical protein B7Z66_02805 [Chromatiales bacterium 21-64-14]|nr:MAG: hypothetical protein B7Z66_02805 [Chromatiales bacterium 21-64-14]HQU14552.1 hypothetical protein [Gammaproteobacteria bacterium]